MATLTLTEKLDQLGARYDELTQQLSTSEVASDSARYQKVAKQHAELEEIVEKHREYKQLEKDLAGAHQMFVEAEDAEMKQMAHDEERELTARKEKAERELKLLLLPKDPLDEKSVIVESRSPRKLSVFAGWPERSRRRHSRAKSVFQAEIRKRRAPRPARTCDGNAGPHPYFGRDRRGSPRSRRNRHQDRSERF